jgi:hypothetical protein
MLARFGKVMALAVLVTGQAAVLPLVVATPAMAQSACMRWNAAGEQDFSSAKVSKTNLTATACSSTADDSTAIGVQCPGRPQIRYYPSGDAPAGIANKTSVAMTFAVGDDANVKTMRYDALNGVFSASMSAADPVLSLLVSGGPLDVTSDLLGTHRFRLIGSTTAIGAVFAGCHVDAAILTPLPRRRPDTPADQ